MGLLARCRALLFLLLVVCTLSGAALAGPGANETGPVSATTTPVPYAITLFIPSSNMIHSDHILDAVNTPERGVLFGTSFGLSMYNGTWSTRHINRDNITEGLMDEFITAVEYDPGGNQWIGYSGGIQIYDGRYYQTIRDQQLLKDPRIQDIQRWDDEMWIATGNAGIHRYKNGRWTWYQPASEGGPGFYDAREMALDPLHAILVIVSADNGHWVLSRTGDGSVRFDQIARKRGTFDLLDHVRRDPRGGVYFFNDTTVMHYTPAAGYVPVLTAKEVTVKDMAINDLAGAPDGRIYLATDDGIYTWNNNAVEQHLSRFEGIGTSEIVRTVIFDAEDRVWFATKGHVGYFYGESRAAPDITIVTFGPPETTETATPVMTPVPAPQVSESPVGEPPATGGLGPILDPILRAITTILSRLGLAPAPQ